MGVDPWNVLGDFSLQLTPCAGRSAFPGWRQHKMLVAETKICTKQTVGHELNKPHCMSWFLRGTEKAALLSPTGVDSLLPSLADQRASGAEGEDGETTAESSVCWLPPQAGLNGQTEVLALLLAPACGLSAHSAFPVTNSSLCLFAKINHPGCWLSRTPGSSVTA